jgi:FlaA1/EpsC-like NDP-sugar epimerase
MKNIEARPELIPSPSHRRTQATVQSLTDAAKRLSDVVRKLVTRPRSSGLQSPRFWLLAVGHLVLFGAIYWIAFLLRFGFEVDASKEVYFWISLPWLLAVKLVIFYVSGHYHGWWRYVTFSDLAALMRASLFSFVVLGAADYFVVGFSIPRGVLILDTLISIVVLGSLRASWRLAREQFRSVLGAHDGSCALVVGTDDTTAMLAHQIQSHPDSQYRIRGFLDTNGAPSRGRRLGQIPVVGHVTDAPKIAAALGIHHILMLSGALPGNKLRNLMKSCEDSGLELKIIPQVHDLFSGDKQVPIRDIEIADLLGRESVELDTKAIAQLIEGRTIMVTGAGGSIGSEICRQLLNFNPKTLLLVGRGENRIFEIERELGQHDGTTQLRTLIGDVTDEPRMRQIFDVYRPEVVFHAAAHKHVPLMEHNVGEAIKNNVLGTKCLADLAHEFEADRFVMISTDKAVHPSSIMGASKHLAERYVHALSTESKTRFVVTRFGNVLGSAGSVVPIFQEQIRQGGPITVTHPDMTRFFMTIPEASQLVLQAASMGRGGEIFVLEMGQPVKIVDLARDLIRLSGLPEGSIEITFTVTRPGEKLYEELYFEQEEMMATTHPKLQIAYHRPVAAADVRRDIAAIAKLCHGPDELIRRKLGELIPEYSNGKQGEKRAPVKSVASGKPNSASPPASRAWRTP